MNVLYDIQQKLKVGKNNRNEFGKYNYRSCSDILEAVKPLLPEGFYVVLSDEVVNIGQRNYVKAIAVLSNGKRGEEEITYSVAAYARESTERKGMDDSQITGATSSYARKYALNGLFAIDDTTDADGMDNRDHKTITDNDKKQNDEYDELVKEHQDTIVAIKDAIKENDMIKLVEHYNLLDQQTIIALWKAPSKGGVFTTAERAAMKSPEFQKELYKKREEK